MKRRQFTGPYILKSRVAILPTVEPRAVMAVITNRRRKRNSKSLLGTKEKEWAALVPEKKAQLLGRLHELFTEDGLDHLRGRAEQLFESYELLDPILEVM